MPAKRLKEMQKRVRLALLNQLTYPKALLGIAQTHTLTGEEIQKAYNCLEACSQIVEAELTLFGLSLFSSSEETKSKKQSKRESYR